MTANKPETELRAAIDPRSIAVIGASENRNKIGGRPIYFLQKFGYRGEVFPINPNRSEVQGLRCYASLDALPQIPEMAVIVVGGDEAVQAIRDCARKGVHVAMMIASGFGETGAAGRAAQDEMVRIARAAGMRMVGPNTQGFANFASGAISSFSTMFIEMPPADGPVAIVSQSGAASVVPYGMLRERGIGVRYVLASGNDADVSVSELVLAVVQDPDIKVILLYAETIQDAHSLAAAAKIARERGVPIVALKSGRSESGAAAASSHTGAIANEDRVVDAFFERHAIWRVPDMHGLVNAIELYLQGWQVKGNRFVALSNSGALCVLAADLAERLGMPLARISDATRSRLAKVLPSFATTRNPVDVTAALLSNSGLFGAVLPILAEDPEVDLLYLAIPVAGEGYDLERFARETAQFAEQTRIPVIVSATQASVRAPFQARGLPAFGNESDAILALHQFSSHMLRMRQPQPSPARAAAIQLPQASGFLNEAESLALLQQAGIAVVAHRLCTSEQQALDAWRELGAAVAVKACSRQLPHKTEHDLVRLNCTSEEQVRAAYRHCQAKLQQLGVAYEGVLVAAMVVAAREFALGVKMDAVFGPVVMLSDGGKYIEALPDNVLLLPPFDAASVRAALQRLRIAPLLRGVRGEAPLDVDQLVEVALRLGELALAAPARLRALDVNPVMVGTAGSGAVVADALVQLS